MRKLAFAFVLLTLCGTYCSRVSAQSKLKRAGHSHANSSPQAIVTTLTSFHQVAARYPDLENLAQGTDGNLYGTTEMGGISDLGTVFTVTLTGEVTVLHSFDGSDGEQPESGVILGTDGDFYGMTGNGNGAGFYGTVFEIDRERSLNTLQEFDNADGAFPTDALVQGADGNFYGTTSEGGNGNGTISKITPAGGLTTLHEFDGTDGSLPTSALVQGIDGNFYGTTFNGGAMGIFGTVFKITPGGLLTTLYSFCSQTNCTDGSFPEAGLVQGSDGNFYGTTTQGGTSDFGTVFTITSNGTLTTLYSFCSESNCTDGKLPEAGLVEGTDGNFYGTTAGLAKNYGTIYQITSSGVLTTLYNFSGTPNGSYPYGGLVQHTNGMFYGVTNEGGTDDVGTVFSLNMGLGPFVTMLPTFGRVGETITILGTDLTGVSSVSFNGTPASFKVPASSYLTATVPAGATTGVIEVVTSGGTLQSNVQFRVRP
jgi:uncharacterized repeat protein (TIGR03803 family)